MTGRVCITLAVLLLVGGLSAPAPADPPPPSDEALLKQALHLNRQGSLSRARGDLAGAEAHFREALGLWRKLYPPERYPDGHRNLATGLSNLGGIHRELGNLPAADECYREAVEVARKLYRPARYPDGHTQLALILGYRGIVLRSAGDYAGAVAHLREALAMLRKLNPAGDDPDTAITLGNLGAALIDRGDRAEAQACLRQAVAAWRKCYPHGHPELAHGLNSLAHVLMATADYAGADACVREALDIWRKSYPPGRYPDGHPDLALGLSNAAVVAHARGDVLGAEKLLREALAMYRKLFPPGRYPDGHPMLVNALAKLAVLLHERGGRSEAQAFLGEALALEQRLQDTFLSGAVEAEGLLFLASLPRTRDAYLSATRRGASGETAYAAVWASRGALARTMQARRQALLLARDPAARDLARRLTATRQALARLLLSPAPARPGQEDLVRTLSERKARLERDLAASLPAFRALRERARRTPAELVRRLPAGAAFIDLLAYVRMAHDAATPGGKGQRWTRCYVAFVLAPGQPIRRVELGPAKEIDDTVDAWRRELTAGGTGGAAAASLRDRLWRRLDTWLPAGTHTVLLAPDGALTRLPWAALPGRRPGSVLLEEYALGVVPYGQFLCGCDLSGPAGGPKDGLLLAVGDVAFGERPARIQVAHSGVDLSRAPPADGAKSLWPALPGTAAELRRVRELAGPRPVRVLRGREASTTGLLAELPRARWAHVATHGFFADARVRSVLRLDEADYERGFRGERVGVGARNPLVLSGLVLAGANLPVKDRVKDDRGILSAEAIAGLDLGGLDLAVLSACETGLGEVAGGEGVFGLQRAFHAGGARSVVASLWKVDDGATQELMARFYENLWQKKLPKLEALRQAQLAIFRGQPSGAGAERGLDLAGIVAVQGRKTVSAAPHVWAAWVLSGDPGDLSSVRPAVAAESTHPAPVAARPADSMLPYAVLGGVLGGLALAAGWWVLRRRPRT